MISAAVPSFWGSPLEDLSSARSATFVASEVSAYGLHESAGLQFAAFPLHGSHDAFSSEELPSIDESLFDFVEVPELEDVDVTERSSPSAIVPLDDLLLEEIPPLEDPCSVDADPCSVGEQWFEQWPQPKLEAASPVEPWQLQKASSVPKISTPTVLVSEEPFCCEQEEIVSSSSSSSSPTPAMMTTTLVTPLSPPLSSSSSPSSSSSSSSPTPAMMTTTPVTPMYAESCGSESPLSCYSVVSDELVAPAEKRRRVSQISMSSYCSSTADSTWSPTSASDSDVDSRRGGRKSRFSAEDRKERKKAQNRTAAERYRQKRKVQEETIDEEEQQLIDGNAELKTEVTKLQAEVSCLKRLMREMLQAKGVVLPPKKQTTP